MLAALKSRQEALEETLRQRLEELKKLCLREAVGNTCFIAPCTSFLACILFGGAAGAEAAIPLPKPVVQKLQQGPAVSNPDCNVTGHCPPRGTPGLPSWFGGLEGAEQPRLLFEDVFQMHSDRLLAGFGGNMLPKCHKKAVLCTANHSSNTFDYIFQKKYLPLHSLHGAGWTSCAFLLPAYSVVQHLRSFLLRVVPFSM